MSRDQYHTPRVKELIRLIHAGQREAEALDQQIRKYRAELLSIVMARGEPCSVNVDGQRYKATHHHAPFTSRVKIEKDAVLDPDYLIAVPNVGLLYRLIAEEGRVIPGVSIKPDNPYVKITKDDREF